MTKNNYLINQFWLQFLGRGIAKGDSSQNKADQKNREDSELKTKPPTGSSPREATVQSRCAQVSVLTKHTKVSDRVHGDKELDRVHREVS